MTGILDDDLAAACLGALELDRDVCRRAALERSWARATGEFLAASAAQPAMDRLTPAPHSPAGDRWNPTRACMYPVRGHNAVMTVTERRHREPRPVILAVTTLVVGIAGLVMAFMGMMALFLGAHGPGMQSLLGLIGWGLLPAIVLAVLSLRRVAVPGQSRLSACWARLPAWLVLSIALMLLLAILAELAIWLVEFSGGGTVALRHYLPILAVLVYTLAVTAGYALIAPPGEGGEHRGPVRHTDPVRRDLE